MIVSVEAALLSAMRNCEELTALVPATRISNEDTPGADATLPYLKLFAVGGTSRAQAGYNNAITRRREGRESWQVSVLAASKLTARQITDILDELFIPTVAGLVLVERTNDADAYEGVPGRWHMAPRYQGEHTVTDT